MVWADMVAGTHDALHDECEPHGVVHAEVLRDAVVALEGGVGLGHRLVHPVPPEDDEHEERAEEDVSEVAVEVVEVGHHAQRVRAQKVVEAQVLMRIQRSSFAGSWI